VAKGRAEGPGSPYYVSALGVQQVASGGSGHDFPGGLPAGTLFTKEIALLAKYFHLFDTVYIGTAVTNYSRNCKGDACARYAALNGGGSLSLLAPFDTSLYLHLLSLLTFFLMSPFAHSHSRCSLRHTFSRCSFFTLFDIFTQSICSLSSVTLHTHQFTFLFFQLSLSSLLAYPKVCCTHQFTFLFLSWSLLVYPKVRYSRSSGCSRVLEAVPTVRVPKPCVVRHGGGLSREPHRSH
jgi:hypothetical protein